MRVETLHPKTAIGVFTNSFLNPKNELTAVMPALSGVEEGANPFPWQVDPIGNRVSSIHNRVTNRSSTNTFRSPSPGELPSSRT